MLQARAFNAATRKNVFIRAREQARNNERASLPVQIDSLHRWANLHDKKVLANTPMGGVTPESVEELLSMWALLGEVMNLLGFEKKANGKYTKEGSVRKLPQYLAQLYPSITA